MNPFGLKLPGTNVVANNIELFQKQKKLAEECRSFLRPHLPSLVFERIYSDDLGISNFCPTLSRRPETEFASMIALIATPCCIAIFANVSPLCTM